MHPVVASIFSASSGFSAVRAYQDLFLLASQKRRVELEFEKADVLVVPSTVTHWKVAEVDEDPLGRNKVLGSFTHFVNLVEYVASSFLLSSPWRASYPARAMSSTHALVPSSSSLCAISVPAGTWTNDSGNEMPFGLTFVAPAGRDAEIMRLAERFAEMQ